MQIRDERPGDAGIIHSLIQAAFEGAPHSSQTEARIVDALRDARALNLSLVAEEGGEIVGHIAFSPVRIGGQAGRFHGLGPVSVRPALQRRGIGSALIREGLRRLRDIGSDACVLLGDPSYYGRFGFASDPQLTYCNYPNPYFQRIILQGDPPRGDTSYHPAFDVE